jgi:hypothetical protein
VEYATNEKVIVSVPSTKKHYKLLILVYKLMHLLNFYRQHIVTAKTTIIVVRWSKGIFHYITNPAIAYVDII